MYKVETLIPDCVGRYVTGASGSVQLANLINGRTYAKCWQALVYWIQSQYNLGNSTNLTPIGILVRSKRSIASIREEGGNPEFKASAFKFLKTFLDQNNLTVRDPDNIQSHSDISSTRMNLQTLAKMAGVEPNNFKVALGHLFCRIGEVLANKEPVAIDFGVAMLRGEKGVVDWVFHHVDTPESTVPKMDIPTRMNAKLPQGGVSGSIQNAQAVAERNLLKSKYPLASSGSASKRGPGYRQQEEEAVHALSLPRSVKQYKGMNDSPVHDGSSLSAHQDIVERQQALEQPVVVRPADTLPNSTTGRFQRRLRGNSPLKAVRNMIEHHRLEYQFQTAGEDDMDEDGGRSDDEDAEGAYMDDEAEYEDEDEEKYQSKSLQTPQKRARNTYDSLPELPSPSSPQSPGGRKQTKVSFSSAAVNAVVSPRSKKELLKSASKLGGQKGILFAEQNARLGASHTLSLNVPHDGLVMAQSMGKSGLEAMESKLKEANEGEGIIRNFLSFSTPSALSSSSSSAAPLKGPGGLGSKMGEMRKFMAVKNLPPVLDSFARTQAATYSDDRFVSSVSAKLASFFTPEACGWTIDLRTGSLVYSNFVPFIADRVILSALEQKLAKREEEARSPEEKLLKARAESKSMMRYAYYVENAIDDAIVAPLPDERFRRALGLLTMNVSSVPAWRIEETVRDILQEIKQDYTRSVKCCILDYVLRNVNERIRLSIPNPPPLVRPDWGNNLPLLVPPAGWRQHIQLSYITLMSRLHCNNSAMVQLLHVWSKYEHILLVDLPDPADSDYPNNPNNPMTMEQFEKRQSSHLARMQKVFATQWIDDCEKVIKKYVKDTGMKEDDKHTVPFFESVATLMSTQLRRIIANSVQAYHDFFMQYNNCPALHFATGADGQPVKSLTTLKHAAFYRHDSFDEDEQLRNRTKNNPRAVFLQKLVDRQVKTQLRIILETTLQEMDKKVMMTFDNIVNGLNDISRVDHKIFPMLDDPNHRNLRMNVRDEAGSEIARLRIQIGTVFNRSIRECSLLLALYEEYNYLLEHTAELDKTLKTMTSLPELKELVQKHRSMSELLANHTNSIVRVGMILIDCKSINQLLVTNSAKLAMQILTHLSNKNIMRNELLASRFQEIFTDLRAMPVNTKELKDLEVKLIKFKTKDRAQLEAECLSVKEQLLFLYDNDARVGMDVLKKVRTTWSQLRMTNDEVAKCEELVDSQRNHFEKAVKERRQDFAIRLQGYKQQIQQMDQYADVKGTNANQYMVKVNSINENLEKAGQEALAIKAQEELLSLPVTEWNQLDENKKTLKPYETLWRLYTEFTRQHAAWLKSDVFSMDGSVVEKTVVDMTQASVKLIGELSEVSKPPATQVDKPIHVAEWLKKELTVFKAYVPTIQLMCNQGMRARHWARVSKQVGVDINPNNHQTLARVIDMELEQHMASLLDISEGATREWAIEKAMESMKGDWRNVVFQVARYRNSNTCTLEGMSVEEVQTLLDEHLVKTQTFKASSFAKFFADDIKNWEHWLMTTQAILDVWMKVQNSWQYLEPVFTSDDIMKAMPEEGMMFKNVDNNWRKLMAEVSADLRVRNVTNITGIQETLTQCFNDLDVIQKGLNAYLESKRRYFPRFYFLSDDDLLQILSETKDPLRVNPFLKKCFEGVHKIEFKENLDIVGMFSGEGEHIPLIHSLNPSDSKGLVEKWLKEFESIMRETVLDVCSKSLRAHATTPRIDWTTEWPAQVVIAVNQIYWTQDTTEALGGGKDKSEPVAKAMGNYLTKLNAELQQVVLKVRGHLTANARTALGALLVIDVHNRDVVDELIKTKAQNPECFEWNSQMRYYWDRDEAVVKVKMITTSVDYGCEYLGNSARLVITGLTDRCYRTLMMALQLNLGGAPEGPAGTGKTETCKDLAKAVGMQCVVFNCSEGLNYQAMGKFFKGISASGAWICFDEFNRLQLEVLSVVAQQIMTIQLAKERQASTFFFDDLEIALVPSATVFITMNPGYAGRSELPDNLKVLFRPVAMMVPDYGLIAQISLFSYGFSEAASLSTKIVATYKLCSEQLSTQDHYDYGMRAVKTVLTSAARLKQMMPDDREDVVVLRTILEVNLPKFLSFDLPLFDGIIRDLFPGLEMPKADNRILMDAVVNVVERWQLQPEPAFLDKVLQVYEMILNRHGFMLVGLPFAGKTQCWKVLQAALNDIGKTLAMGENEAGCKSYVINPKSQDNDQLYGYFTKASNEWVDGVLASKYKECANATGKERQWLLFDGPVDAMWVENMNTVLDDSKKLCLMSGAMIAMSPMMSVMFEVRDLAVASPATVSRCGMIYLEPHKLGWAPFVKSWLQKMPTDRVSPDFSSRVAKLIDWLVPSCLRFLRAECVLYSPQVDANMVFSVFRIFDSLMGEWTIQSSDEKKFLREQLRKQKEAEGTPLAEPTDAELVSKIEGAFLFSIVWSIGGVVDDEGRKKFDKFLREVCKEVSTYKLANHFPKAATVFDHVFNVDTMEWSRWADTLERNPYVIPDDAKFTEIVIPTVDTVRYSYMINMFIQNKQPLLLVGPTGTGKSIQAIDILVNRLNTATNSALIINFSAQTSEAQLQALIDSKVDKRRRGVFGPPGGKFMSIFLDDLNMPKPDRYGVQNPIELLRQWMDYGGWYDTAERSFRTITDVQFIAAMGPPGGGRNPTSDRFLRHMTQVSMTPFEDSTMNMIFGSILQWHFKVSKFEDRFKTEGQKIVDATRNLYTTACSKLLPTPSKCHYTFNMRDFSRVIQGCLLLRPAQCETTATLHRLWIHEASRVFGDRLINAQDNLLFVGWIKDCVKSAFGADLDALLKHLKQEGTTEPPNVLEMKNLYFGEYFKKELPRYYCEIPQVGEMEKCWSDYLKAYNAESKQPMNLVMFRFAVEHISRVIRVLKLPQGHTLCVGLGGSGRQSLTRLAAFVLDFKVFSIEISRSYDLEKWKEDMKSLLKMVGVETKTTVFLMSDTQIKEESFLEDINGLLNTGEIANLWNAEDTAGITEAVGSDYKRVKKQDGTPQQMMGFFTEQVKANLHICLCMSPIGDAFRRRVLMFPALVNCMTIDWYTPWPEDALRAVAATFLADVEMDDPSMKESCVRMCIDFHSDVKNLADEYKYSMKRYYYVTPTSYLELIATFKSLLGVKREEISTARSRYLVGLQKLNDTAAQIEVMQAELEAMKPVLEVTSVETDAMIVKVDAETVEANKIRESVAKDEAVAKVAADGAKAIETQCNNALAEALPALAAAESALKTLVQGDIAQVKAYNNPANQVKLVFECLCFMMGVPPVRSPNPDGSGKMIIDYWEPSKKKILSNPRLLSDLQNFDKATITEKVLQKIRSYQTNPDFAVETVTKVSKACGAICKWIWAIEGFVKTNNEIEPMREKLKVAQAEYAVVKVSLDKAQAELHTVETKVASLTKTLNDMKAKKQALEEKMERNNIQLIRAEKLLSGLGGEKTRWTEMAQILGEQYRALTGDVLLSSGLIAYLGAFTAQFRTKVTTGWVEKCKDLGVPSSAVFSLSRALGEPVKIRKWVIDGLPNDTFSIDNAIVIDKSRRWPLMIDPQNQANRWIKNQEKEAKIVVIKQGTNYFRALEGAIQMGRPVLLEDIGEEIDAALEPLLLKSIFKKAGAMVIKLGDSEIEYNKDFKFFITTKLRSPHYLPEVCTRVTLLNFMITPEGLSDQLLGIVVAKEKPALEKERQELVISSATNKRKLKEIEDQILAVMSNSKGNILEDQNAIDVLSASKVVSNQIEADQKIADKTQAEIDSTRSGYQPIAFHAQVLFFCISELCAIDPMYQYSLSWYIGIFVKAIANSQPSSELAQRLDNLRDYLTYSIYTNVCRSLFEKDKLLFSALLCVKLFQSQGKMDNELWRFILTGGVTMEKTIPENPAKTWLGARGWEELYRLGKYQAFAGIDKTFKEHEDGWKKVYGDSSPHEMPFPGHFNDLDALEKMAVLRTLRPDKLMVAVRDFVRDNMGEKFILPPIFDLTGPYKDSSPDTPLIFVLSSGSDPAGTFKTFAADMGFAAKVDYISLGQGQGVKARKMIYTACKAGTWVLLQNCHLATSWLPELETIIYDLGVKVKETTEIHPEFRLWLTSYPTEAFPVAILENGVKLVQEAPKGMRANLLSSFQADPICADKWYEDVGDKKKELRALVYSLCFFHALVQERRNFGPLGWNISYGFNTSDLIISARQLKMLLGEKGEIPLTALKYLTGECNYGGRVTDDKDRRTLNSLLSVFYNVDAASSEKYALSASGNYVIPAEGPVQSYLDYINTLPLTTPPEVFGLHENADITKDLKESNNLLASLLTTSGSGGGGGGADAEAKKTQMMLELAAGILNRLPPAFDTEQIQAKYPAKYEDSMNTVLVQECIRFNKLTDKIRATLKKLMKALVGEEVMSLALEEVANEMYNTFIPTQWKSVSYPSLKPLGSYVNDLLARIKFLNTWIDKGMPTVTWFSGVFFPQSFLTGVLQNFVRKYKTLAIDQVAFDFQVMGKNEIDENKSPKPADGVYVTGLYLEGAAWSYEKAELVDSTPKITFTACPILWLKPCKSDAVGQYSHYVCPVYRVSSRFGVLMTTGHSTNYVMGCLLPTSESPDKWIRRGVALLCSLDD